MKTYFVTPEAIELRHVGDEWLNYVTSRKIIIPVLLKPIEKFPYQLEPLQRVIFTNGATTKHFMKCVMLYNFMVLSASKYQI